MPRLALVIPCVLVLAVGLAGSRLTADAAPLTTCVAPTFRGHQYRPYALRKTRLVVADRVGTAVLYRNWNLQCFREERFVHRLRGIAAGRAVSLDGSPRRLLIEGDTCIRAQHEASLVRCLKRRA